MTQIIQGFLNINNRLIEEENISRQLIFSFLILQDYYRNFKLAE